MKPDRIAEVWSMLDRGELARVANEGPRCVFATVSGAHLYGFASPDSDVDLRGAFLSTAREVLGLDPPSETLTLTADRPGLELDYVSHDLRKFARMMVQHNGYVLEQLFSPLVVVTSDLFDELRALGAGCVTRPIVRHYLGFANGRRKRLREPEPTVKHLLYAYRVYLSGIHAMETGEIEANLECLNERFRLPAIDELIARKRTGAERLALRDDEVGPHERELGALEARLVTAHEASSLPDEATTRDAIEDLVIRARVAHEAR
jgi:predicted nucleotidyltransferase